jgi:signal transduction histidine kinase
MASAVNLATLHLPDRRMIRQNYGAIPMIECSGQDLRQVFLNLLLNVTHVTKHARGLHITTSAERDVVRILIEDRDWNIDPQLIGRSFDPVLESQSASGSYGLSLSLAYQIVRQMSGNLTVDLLPGGGTRVCVDLPIIESELQVAGETSQ